jgi:hypothetical protein
MKKQLRTIQKLVNEPLINQALEAVATVELRLGNSASITAAADAVGKAANEFAEHADGKQLAAIEPMLPQPNRFKNYPK